MKTINKDDMSRPLLSVFDLDRDENQILRLAFNPIDYNRLNHITRPCFECDQLFPQGAMHEFGTDETEPKACHGKRKWYEYSIFVCQSCWSTSKLSNASNWTA